MDYRSKLDKLFKDIQSLKCGELSENYSLTLGEGFLNLLKEGAIISSIPLSSSGINMYTADGIAGLDRIIGITNTLSIGYNIFNENGNVNLATNSGTVTLGDIINYVTVSNGNIKASGSALGTTLHL